MLISAVISRTYAASFKEVLLINYSYSDSDLTSYLICYVMYYFTVFFERLVKIKH